MKYLLLFFIPILYMLGGQIKTQIRRFGVPSFSVAFAFFRNSKDRKKAFIFLLLIPILCTGYGVKSFYMKVFKKDWLVRLAYALSLSIPFLILGTWYAPFILMGAFSIRAGGFRIGRYDFLWEDLIRGVGLALCVAL